MKYNLKGDPAAEALCNPEKITEALKLGAKDAMRLHKQTGNPMVVWRDGKVVWVPPEEIPLDEDETVVEDRPSTGVTS